MATRPTVGILALQGDFAEHASALRRVGVPLLEVRTSAHLEQVAGLVIPGGESTTMARLVDAYDLRTPLIDYAKAGRPIWGTCAGMILLADRVVEDRPTPLGLMEILVHRNGFGRQVDSFETDLSIEGLTGGPFHAVFIRAPVVCEVGLGIEVLSRMEDGSIVAVRKGPLLGTAFHPELTDDPRLHRYFVAMVEEAAAP